MLKRLGLAVTVCSEAEAATRLTTEHPTVAVLSIDRDPSGIEPALVQLEDGRVPHSRIIAVSERAADDPAVVRWSHVSNTAVMTGGHRVVGRILEEISVSLGLQPRRHLRGRNEVPVEIQTTRGRCVGRLIDISTTGARFVVEAPTLESLVTLGASLPEGVVTVTGQVVWRRQRGAEIEAGVKFAELRPSMLQVIQRFVGASPAIETTHRQTPRYSLRKRMRLKVRVTPPSSDVRSYLKVLDLSLSGCLALSYPEVQLTQGHVVQAAFFGPSGTFGCTAEVVRTTTTPGGNEYGLRFAELDPKAYAELRRILSTFDAPMLPQPRRPKAMQPRDEG